MIDRPQLFGAAYSVYVRIVRLSLSEKGVPYDLNPIDIFAKDGPPPDYRERHPFGRIPAFMHAGFSIYETSAITRYIDEAFDGPALQPIGVRERARCNQVASIADNYVYPHLVWGIYVEQVSKPKRGERANPERVASALAVAKTCLRAMETIIGESHWLVGPSLTLADIYVAPMFAYFVRTTEGQELLREHPRLVTWWSRMRNRPSMRQSEHEPPSASE